MDWWRGICTAVQVRSFKKSPRQSALEAREKPDRSEIPPSGIGPSAETPDAAFQGVSRHASGDGRRKHARRWAREDRVPGNETVGFVPWSSAAATAVTVAPPCGDRNLSKASRQLPQAAAKRPTAKRFSSLRDRVIARMAKGRAEAHKFTAHGSHWSAGAGLELKY